MKQSFLFVVLFSAVGLFSCEKSDTVCPKNRTVEDPAALCPTEYDSTARVTIIPYGGPDFGGSVLTVNGKPRDAGQFSFQLYDRWGQKLEDFTFELNARHNYVEFTPAPTEGAYVYLLKHKNFKQAGTITYAR